MTSGDFDDPSLANCIAILPVAAIEQHGPHLPLATDTAIARGLIGILSKRIPDDIAVLTLPVQAIGKSDEHLKLPGTLSLGAEHLINAWVDLGACVRRAGLFKLLIVNSHGGNNAVMDIVARELRIRLDMLVVTTQWNRFGTPVGLIDELEIRYGVHAGMVETSLMLHFRPELVRLEKAKNFRSSAAWMEERFHHLHVTGKHNMGWAIRDLNPEGACGNAAAASAAIGEAIALHQVDGLIELLDDIKKFDLARLANRDATSPDQDIRKLA